MQSTLQPRLIQRFVYDSDIARDIEQETFLRVYQHISHDSIRPAAWARV